MKKTKSLLVVAAGALLAAGCSTNKIVADHQFSEARVLQVDTKSNMKTVTADLDVFLRVEWSTDYSPEQVASMGGNIENMHNRAAFELLKEYHADELVAPTWNVRTIIDDPKKDGWWRVEVIGFLARFKNWNDRKGVLDCNVDMTVIDVDRDGNRMVITPQGDLKK